ncbi:MAG: ABC transporter ATP-binding protein [Myxococcales bacterium]|nr:ABC transporter ATP-binding protein [Myxococcales bacterium]
MGDPAPVIDVDDLSYRYPGRDEDAVRGVSFQVAPGEIFGFLGPSGAGKSTTQKVLIKLLTGYRGRAQVFGRDLSSWGDDFYERVGVSFELPASYRKLTARENLALFASLYSGEVEPIDALLEMVGLREAADQRVSEFSKGMQMRLNFVRALLNRPELLFLDEPTGGLDPGNAVRIKALIRERRAAGTTVFLTTHDMTVADELCDRVAFIIDGELPVIDAPRKLKLAHGERRVRVELRGADGLTSETLPLADFDEGALAELRGRGREIETIHSEEASLEQVFLAVTGRGLH